MVDGSLGFAPRALRCVGERLASETGEVFAERGTFCLLEVRVENTGAVAFTYRSRNQRAVVGVRRYFPSDEGLRATDHAPFQTSLAPGAKVDLVIVFDLPAPPSEVELHDSARSPGVRLDVSDLPEEVGGD